MGIEVGGEEPKKVVEWYIEFRNYLDDLVDVFEREMKNAETVLNIVRRRDPDYYYNMLRPIAQKLIKKMEEVL